MLLPVGICDGSNEVAAAVAWSQMVVNYSSMLMQAEAEKARRPCRLRWTTRPDLMHGKFVADHGLVVMLVGTILQDWGRKVYQQVPIGMEQRRPRSRRGATPLA